MLKLRPSIVIVLSYLIVVLIGAFILSLPISSANGQQTNFINALFTANSATCVTGLVCLDTGTYFSLFGKLVILALIQIGGLGYMTLSTFFMVLFKRKLFITEKMIAQETLNIYSGKEVVNIIRKILVIVFAIEGIGALLLALWWLPNLGIKKSLFYGIFHSVAAFCNAGFALFPNYSNLMYFRSDIFVNVVITTLIILGGIGFLVINDVIQNRRFTLQTKVVIASTVFLILFGTLSIYGIEYFNPQTLGNLNNFEKLIASYFQSVTARTAGFNTLIISQMRTASHLILMALMFIGASPGGTGGGIKTTTFALIFATIYASLRESKNTIVFERRIPPETIRKSFTIFFLAVLFIATAVFLLNGTENFSLKALSFEVISAFGTVGLSLGITPFLSDLGKLIIVGVMFVGRVGTITLLTAISTKSKVSDLQFPKEGISVG